MFTSALTDLFPGKGKPTLFVLICLVFLIFQFKYKPFAFRYLNRLELISLVVSSITGILGVLLFSKEMRDAIDYFLVLIILANLFFVFQIIWCIFKYSNLILKIRFFKKYISKRKAKGSKVF